MRVSFLKQSGSIKHVHGMLRIEANECHQTKIHVLPQEAPTSISSFKPKNNKWHKWHDFKHTRKNKINKIIIIQILHVLSLSFTHTKNKKHKHSRVWIDHQNRSQTQQQNPHNYKTKRYETTPPHASKHTTYIQTSTTSSKHPNRLHKQARITINRTNRMTKNMRNQHRVHTGCAEDEILSFHKPLRIHTHANIKSGGVEWCGLATPNVACWARVREASKEWTCLPLVCELGSEIIIRIEEGWACMSQCERQKREEGQRSHGERSKGQSIV